MMPMVFWASFVPWLNPINEALTNCSRPKTTFTRCGRQFRSRANNSPITTKPSIRPKTGETIMGRTTLGHRPSGCPLESTPDHLITAKLPAAVASVAPHRPPISAWLELEGSPNHQVNRFQTIAATRAQRTVLQVDELGRHQALADGLGHGGPPQRPEQVAGGGQHHRLARAEDPRGHHGGDGVGGVVKAVDVLEHQPEHDHAEYQRHGGVLAV